MNALESAILEAFVRRLPPSIAEVAQQQITAIKRVAHKPADQCVGFVIENQSGASEALLFPNRDPSISAAFVFGRDGSGEKYRANIVVNHGVLDSIALSEPPGEQPTDVSVENFEVVLVTDLGSSGEESEAKPFEQLDNA